MRKELMRTYERKQEQTIRRTKDLNNE